MKIKWISIPVVIILSLMIMTYADEQIRFRKIRPLLRRQQRQTLQQQQQQGYHNNRINRRSWSNNRINSNSHTSSSSWNTGKQKLDRKIPWTTWSSPSSSINTAINVIDTGKTRQESWNHQPATYNNSPPGAYHWGYRWIDEFGNQMFREETADGYGTVTGRYSFRDYNGLLRIVEYIADHNGYRTRIRSNEPGIVTSNPAGAEIIRFENENDIPA
ncbi:cuticle protein 57A-like protein [Euroglyphus maynei]|uniref:Cuticle protein 57A-like protein n=1 Tax=Euroglyphus maynei TaxID=6958 RepID=A0A1Y3AQ77_EURMA|nr:cuticle protein 57A-like protein [Euroglyphus maynei]